MILECWYWLSWCNHFENFQTTHFNDFYTFLHACYTSVKIVLKKIFRICSRDSTIPPSDLTAASYLPHSLILSACPYGLLGLLTL